MTHGFVAVLGRLSTVYLAALNELMIPEITVGFDVIEPPQECMLLNVDYVTCVVAMPPTRQTPRGVQWQGAD